MKKIKKMKLNRKEIERFFTINKDGKSEFIWLNKKQQIKLNDEIRKSMEKR